MNFENNEEALEIINFFDEPDEKSGACSDSAMARKSRLKINRLLERLHQADYKTLGSIVLNIYKPGSQHVDHVENQYFYGSLTPRSAKGRLQGKNPSPKGEGDFKVEGELPEPLATEEAMALWEKVQKAGYVDDNYQPLISRTQAALLADAMAERLGICEKWKVFETLWNRKYMYRDYYEALNQKKSLEFQDKLKNLFL
jgi:hypothetical protein